MTKTNKALITIVILLIGVIVKLDQSHRAEIKEKDGIIKIKQLEIDKAGTLLIKIDEIEVRHKLFKRQIDSLNSITEECFKGNGK